MVLILSTAAVKVGEYLNEQKQKQESEAAVKVEEPLNSVKVEVSLNQ